jgi:peptidoglycan/LPS O-acetylase OafA/YrhL
MTQSSSRLPSLDGIRGLAALFIVGTHAVRFAHPPFPPAGLLSRVGAEFGLGVDLFFVLSGFLITGILLRSVDKPRYFKNFYARRALRIFPVYYLFVAFMVLVVPALVNDATFSHALKKQEVALWLYVSNLDIALHGWPAWPGEMLTHAWSLAIEEQFYLAWPILIKVLGRRKLPAAIWSGYALSIGLRAAIGLLGYGSRARVVTPAHLDGFMLGAWLSYLFAEGATAATLRRWAWSFAAVGLAIRIYASTIAFENLANVLIASESLGFAALLAFSLAGDECSTLNRVLRNRGLVVVGTYSYGLYLFHQPLFAWAGQYVSGGTLLTRSTLLFVGVGGVSLALAVASYHLFEMRFLRLKSRFDN